MPMLIRTDLNPYQKRGQGCVLCFHTFLPGEVVKPFARLVVNGRVEVLARACPECRPHLLVPPGWEILD